MQHSSEPDGGTARPPVEKDRFLATLADATQRLVEPGDVMQVAARMLAVHLDVDRCAYAEIEAESVFVITGDYARDVPSIVGRWPVAAFGRECVRSMLAGEPYVVADVETGQILGAAILGIEGDEAIHGFIDAMHSRTPYPVLKWAVPIHPTVSELIPTLLGRLKSA